VFEVDGTAEMELVQVHNTDLVRRV
jgi:hypothetical protein